MSDVVLKVENLSKLYRLGEVGTGTISHDLNRWWAKIRGKEDPYTLVGQTNDRSKKAESDFVWSLKDINFEVRQGEVLGIIGRNGAGKSTLLKLISQITSPTTGSIKVRGRIASLLEVGTGMNPELTARENIYLNGAILGMTKKEIVSKFDEIVDFSGCAMYVDTPVKRFSSGMRVRLGFAVAAFLEPEILIVDEVLAVGDAEFQKKAIGKMKEVSEGGGRTVLFVSHDLTAVKSLCTRGIVLNNGKIFQQGKIDDCIDLYINNSYNANTYRDFTNVGNHKISIKNIQIRSDRQPMTVETEFVIDFNFTVLNAIDTFHCTLSLSNLQEQVVFSVVTTPQKVSEGNYKCSCKVPGDLLNYKRYKVKLFFVENELTPVLTIEDAIFFEVFDKKREINYYGEWRGVIRPKLEFSIEKIE